MDDFSVTSEQNGQVTVMTVSGRVDSLTAASLDAELEKLLHDSKRLVLNLNGVVYMSSAGIRAIVKALHSAQKANGGVKLATVPERVEEVLQTVGMTHMLRSYPSVAEAIASF